MAWFNGIIHCEEKQLEKEFPVVITENLRSSGDGNKIAIINDFPVGGTLYKLSDPHLEEGVCNSKVFYYLFLGENAERAERFIHGFVFQGYGKSARDVSLYRKENDCLFFYSYGELHLEAALSFKRHRYCTELSETDLFVLPMKAFAYKCPVCGERALRYRGMFEICEFCGWEDEGIDNDDEEPFLAPNGSYTIRQYREEYKKQLRKLYDFPYETLTKEQKVLPSWLWNYDNQKD